VDGFARCAFLFFNLHGNNLSIYGPSVVHQISGAELAKYLIERQASTEAAREAG